jgi:hypothetical protein
VLAATQRRLAADLDRRGGIRGLRGTAPLDEAELADRVRQCGAHRRPRTLGTLCVGAIPATRVPRSARPRAGDEHLLFRRALRVHGHLLHLAVLPVARRLSQLAERLPRRDGDLPLHSLAVPDRAAATRRCRTHGHVALVLRIDIGSPHSSPFSNPVAAVPSLHAGFALGVAWRRGTRARRG